MLRCYPLPHLSFRLLPRHFELAGNVAAKLSEEDPELHRRRLTDAESRVLAQAAFATCYGLSLDRQPRDFLWDQDEDFQIDRRKIKLVVGNVNSRWGNSGAQTACRISRKALDRTRVGTFVLAALDPPYVGFLGWMTKEGVKAHLSDWSAEPNAGSSHLNPLWELDWLETLRVGGTYV